MSNVTVAPATDYASLLGGARALLDGPTHESYAALVRALGDAMREHFPALTLSRNPLSARLASWSRPALKFLIEEYSAFSNAAIHMLLEARIRNHRKALAHEIRRNIEEEMGALTEGIAHLELMRHGYRRELGIETEGLEPTAVTRDFIERMNTLFRARDNAYLAGVLLAFESTAVDEFRVVEKMLRRYQALAGARIPAQSLTGLYLAGHVVAETADPHNDPEMDHYRGMVAAVGEELAIHELPSVARGYLAVCLELNRWWEQIVLEAPQREVRELLAPARSGAIEPALLLFDGASETARLERQAAEGAALPRHAQDVH